MKRDWKQWTKAAVIRAIKTIAQTAIATVGVAATMQDVNWLVVGSTAGCYGIEGNFAFFVLGGFHDHAHAVGISDFGSIPSIVVCHFLGLDSLSLQ